MHKTLAEYYADEFVQQSKMAFDRDFFAEQLMSVNPVGFSTALPEKRQLLSGVDDCYFYLQIRRVLNNRLAHHVVASEFKHWLNETLHPFGGYSSNTLVRDIQDTTQLVDILYFSGSAYSLLGKIESYDIVGEDQRIYLSKRPLLVIPGIQNRAAIDEWEKKHTRYFMERGLIFRHEHRLPAKEYPITTG